MQESSNDNDVAQPDGKLGEWDLPVIGGSNRLSGATVNYADESM